LNHRIKQKEMKAKVQIGNQVQNKNGNIGEIVKIITKSTGYVLVKYSDCEKKEMAFNLTDANGELLKAKPESNSDAKHAAKMAASNLNGRKFYENADGSFNSVAMDEFEAKREAAKRNSHSNFN
jgi:hypothetical protein